MFNFFAMGADAATGIQGFFQQASPILLMAAFAVGFYFLAIAPQRKRDKQIKAMMEGIKAGDRVRTIGGIYGTVHQVKEDMVTLAVGPDKVKIVFAKGAIATIEDAEVEKSLEDGVSK